MQCHGMGKYHDHGRTLLHMATTGTMTGQRYTDEVLLPHVHLFHGVVSVKLIFMDDNTICQRKLAAQDCVDRERVFNALCNQRVF